MKLRDNKWGFDLNSDNPFRVFTYLREIAVESVGERDVVDLSRGEPGFGFSPSVAGREFYAFLLEIDQILNNPGEHFVNNDNSSYNELLIKIFDHADEIYTETKAVRLKKNFEIFVEKVESCAKAQGLDWDKRRVVFEIFKYSAVSGGSYLDPKGELLVRLMVADHCNKKLNLGVDYSDIILMQGISHGIGTIFKVLFDEKIEFLKPGDTVMLNSPVYAPYNAIAKNRGLNTFSIPVDPATGEVIGSLDEILSRVPDNLKLICMIDPNNPIGFMSNEEFLRKIADLARERNALIVSDEVYTDFFEERVKNIMHFARERTVMISGRSKIERATGLRFGEFVIAKEAQKYIAEEILGGKLDIATDLMQLLVFGKAPGVGVRGEIQHVTFVPGPSEYLGLAHMIFGNSDREDYLRRIKLNMENFYEILGLPYNKNLYYSCFDLMSVPGNNRSDIAPEELFVNLAKKGLVLLPANLFFPESERRGKDCRTFARASLPNVVLEKAKKAAEIIKEYMVG